MKLQESAQNGFHTFLWRSYRGCYLRDQSLGDSKKRFGRGFLSQVSIMTLGACMCGARAMIPLSGIYHVTQCLHGWCTRYAPLPPFLFFLPPRLYLHMYCFHERTHEFQVQRLFSEGSSMLSVRIQRCDGAKSCALGKTHAQAADAASLHFVPPDCSWCWS
jgi:hypothetical protein